MAVSFDTPNMPVRAELHRLVVGTHSGRDWHTQAERDEKDEWRDTKQGRLNPETLKQQEVHAADHQPENNRVDCDPPPQM